MDKKTKANLQVTKKLYGRMKMFMKVLGMEDWSISLSYTPKPESEAYAEIECESPQNKTAKIVVYRTDVDRKGCSSDEVLFHELMHAKLGMLTVAYKKALDGQMEIIKDTIQMNEEAFIESMTDAYFKTDTKKKVNIR